MIMKSTLPVLDEKVEAILQGLANGQTREQLAETFGNSSWKSVDMYMRRRDYTWDARNQTYTPDVEVTIPQLKDTSKAGKVVYFLEQGNDPKSIAIRLGFKDHRDMASYMTAKGYEWHSEESNYRKKVGVVEHVPQEVASSSPSIPVAADIPVVPINYGTLPQEIAHYLPLLALLDEHQEKLVSLLQPNENIQIPRYLVPGIAKTKTIQMMNTLQDLIADYCNEYNIQQRVLFEVALIEFFQKHGFRQEIDALLKR